MINKKGVLNEKEILFLFILCIIVTGFFSCGDDGGGDEDTIPPGVLSITDVITAENQVTVSWEASADADFDHAVISCSDGSVENIFDALTCVISGLTADSEYTFTVNASDNAGNLSEDVNITVWTTLGDEIDIDLIFTADDLNAVNDDLSGVYLVMADVDLSGYSSGEGWEPIGDNPGYFTGIFYGNNHVISNLYINRPGNDYQGLFG